MTDKKFNISYKEATKLISYYRNTGQFPEYKDDSYASIPSFLKKKDIRDFFSNELKATDNADLFYKVINDNTEKEVLDNLLNYDYSIYSVKGNPSVKLKSDNIINELKRILDIKKEEPKEEPKVEPKKGLIKVLTDMYNDGFEFYNNNRPNKFIEKQLYPILKNIKETITTSKKKGLLLKQIREAKEEIDLQQLVMKKYKSPLEIWELYTASPVYANIAYYYILNKHNNDCIIIAPNKKLYTQTIKLVGVINDTEKTVELRFPLLKENGDTIKDYFDAVKECSSNFVALPFTIIIRGSSSGGHANMIIINKQLKKAYRFEPHGQQTEIGKSYDEVLDKMDSKLDEIFANNNFIYERSSSICPRNGFQGLEEETKKEIGEKGYCQMWSAFFLDLVLTYPKLNMKELIDKSFLVLEKDPKQFQQFIRDYASGFVGILEELVNKLGTTDEMRKKIANFFTNKKDIDDDDNDIWDKVVDLVNDMTMEQSSKIKKDNTILIDKMDGSGKQSSGDYQLHTVIVKKPVDLNRAKQISGHFIDHKPTYRQTKTSYRFKNIDKSEFKEKSFRTKKVNQQISLVYGELKEPQRLQGAGLKDLWNKAKKKFNEIKETIKLNPVLGILGETYCGPFTQLKGQAPVSETSKTCRDHDIRYNTIEKAKKAGISRKEREDMMRDADEIMLKELDEIKESKLRDKIVHTISKAGIKAKVWAEDKGLIDRLAFAGGLYYKE